MMLKRNGLFLILILFATSAGVLSQTAKEKPDQPSQTKTAKQNLV